MSSVHATLSQFQHAPSNDVPIHMQKRIRDNYGRANHLKLTAANTLHIPCKWSPTGWKLIAMTEEPNEEFGADFDKRNFRSTSQVEYRKKKWIEKKGVRKSLVESFQDQGPLQSQMTLAGCLSTHQYMLKDEQRLPWSGSPVAFGPRSFYRPHNHKNLNMPGNIKRNK